MLVYAALFVFAFQLLSDFVESIYAFGLLGTSIPPEIAAVLFFFSPVLLLPWRKGVSRRGLTLLVVLVLLATLVEVMLDTRGRMLAAGLGVAAFLMFLPARLAERARAGDVGAGPALGAGLALGLAVTILDRAWHSGVDPSGTWPYRLVLWALAVAAVVTWLRAARRDAPAADTAQPAPQAGFGRVAGLCTGLVAALTLLYFAFASPNVIARWTGASYLAVLIVMMLSLSLFALAMAAIPARLRGLGLAGSLALTVALAAALLAYQPAFPPDSAGYPFPEPAAAPSAPVSLWLLCALFPVVLLDFGLYAGELIRVRPRPRALAGGFLVAALFLVVIVFAHVFTTVYDYIPVVGPWFRDRFWVVYLVLGLALTLPLLLIRRGTEPQVAARPRALALATVIIGVAVVLGAWITTAAPVTPAPGGDGLRVLTFNIQQGYDANGQRGYDSQLALMRQVGADIIGLQETDTNRIAGGNADLVRYFADGLDLHSYYGPKTVAGTFGIALLSRYPIEDPRTFYMYSEGEQTAAIVARITVEGRPFDVFVTHLGNGGPIVQQQAFLSEVARRQNVIAMGDFNFRPDGDQYRLTVQALADAWLLKWPGGIDDQGQDPARRIDHIFVSPGIVVRDARFLTGPESDHPALVVEIEP